MEPAVEPTPPQRLAAQALVHCETQAVAARRARVSTRTVRRWRACQHSAAVEAEFERSMTRFRHHETAERLDRTGDYLAMYAAASRVRRLAVLERDAAGIVRRAKWRRRA